ncbi:NAD(P)-binding protein [Daedalea quercina L-15889]|uniref:NAD(P)-binding protein n=1 Tax=Daedalea quercina L-15889 TaxID=1314783 RepID=A0A165U736_9APHY|nr:NAD(P)-binding protein [Daedalea quercina L-15889]
MAPSTSSKVWLITGSSTGFGRAMTELVLSKGDIAVATLRTPSVIDDLASRYGKDRLLVLKLDVTKPQEITDAFATAVKHFGRIDAVFNNAGYGVFGETEAVPEDVARQMFEVDFWGAIHVSKEAIRVFREVNKPAGGRLLNNASSAGGIDNFPGLTYYCAAKSALVAFSEALSREVSPEWNIKVIAISPGAFRTPSLSHIVNVPPHPAYEHLSKARAGFVDALVPTQLDTEKGVDVLYRIAALPEPPVFFPLIGVDAIETVKAKWAERTKATETAALWSQELSLAAPGSKA